MTNPVPGFYDDGQGNQRWWDGERWTDRTQAPQQIADPDTLWEAVGKPITGMGAGRYRLTKELLFFEKGMLTTTAQQIQTYEIFDVDASQSLTQKPRGVGTITLSTIRATGRERVFLDDVADFRNGVQRINEAAHAARDAKRVKEQTQNVNYVGAVPSATAVPQAAPPVDLNAELAKLAAFHGSGVLTDEEFTAGKRKLLGL